MASSVDAVAAASRAAASNAAGFAADAAAPREFRTAVWALFAVPEAPFCVFFA